MKRRVYAGLLGGHSSTNLIIPCGGLELDGCTAELLHPLQLIPQVQSTAAPAEARHGPTRGLASPEAPSTGAEPGEVGHWQIRAAGGPQDLAATRSSCLCSPRPRSPWRNPKRFPASTSILEDNTRCRVKQGPWLQSPGNSGQQLPGRSLHSRRIQRLKQRLTNADHSAFLMPQKQTLHAQGSKGFASILAQVVPQPYLDTSGCKRP